MLYSCDTECAELNGLLTQVPSFCPLNMFRCIDYLNNCSFHEYIKSVTNSTQYGIVVFRLLLHEGRVDVAAQLDSFMQNIPKNSIDLRTSLVAVDLTPLNVTSLIFFSVLR